MMLLAIIGYLLAIVFLASYIDEVRRHAKTAERIKDLQCTVYTLQQDFERLLLDQCVWGRPRIDGDKQKARWN